MSQLGALSSFLGGAGGGGGSSYGAPISSGPNENRSVNIVGSPGGMGSFAGLNSLMAFANGSSANGGFTSQLMGDGWAGGLSRDSTLSKNLPIVLIGGVVLLAIFMFKRG